MSGICANCSAAISRFSSPGTRVTWPASSSAHASLVVANSEITAATAAGSIPAEMLRTVPNGIDLRSFTPRCDGRSAGERLVVAMVASLTSRTKKHALFIEAVHQLHETAPLEFRIYGHDPGAGGARSGDRYADEIHGLIRQLGLADRFRFPGHVADPAQIMAEIDLLVHPADNESFGRIVVEAMAAGLPVVGVRGGGVGEIVVDGRTGLLAPPDEPVELAACIARARAQRAAASAARRGGALPRGSPLFDRQLRRGHLERL